MQSDQRLTMILCTDASISIQKYRDIQSPNCNTHVSEPRASMSASTWKRNLVLILTYVYSSHIKALNAPEARGMDVKATAARNKALSESILIPNHLVVTR